MQIKMHTGQLAHLQSLINTLFCLERKISIFAESMISIFQLVFVAEQAGLCLT